MDKIMNRPSKAVIVAAGRSSRLYPLTRNLPKGLLEVGGQTMLNRSVELLRKSGIERICIVTGFCRTQIKEYLGHDGITYLFNPFYAETNNMGSLWFARDWVDGGSFLYLHNDIVYHPDLLRRMLSPLGGETARLLVDIGPTDEEAMKVRVVNGRFVESNKQIPIDAALGEWVGIAGFSDSVTDNLFLTIERALEERMFQAYDTEAFTRMAGEGVDFKIIPTDNYPWVEVDFVEDLNRARRLFG